MREAFRGPTSAAVYLAIVFGVAVLAALFSADAAAYAVMPIPGIAVLVILLALTREGWTRSGWVALGVARFGFRVWPLAFLGPIAILAFIYGSLVFFDQIALTLLGGFRSPLETLARLPLALLVATLIGLCEEIGWRGYLLPRVVGRNPVAGMLLVGFCQGLVRVPMIVAMAIADGGGGGPLGAAALVASLYLATFTAADSSTAISSSRRGASGRRRSPTGPSAFCRRSAPKWSCRTRGRRGRFGGASTASSPASGLSPPGLPCCRVFAASRLRPLRVAPQNRQYSCCRLEPAPGSIAHDQIVDYH